MGFDLTKDERVIVGVNRYQVEHDELEIPVLRIDPKDERAQVELLHKVKAERDNGRVQATLEKLREVAKADGNTFEAIYDCCKAYATVGEMCDVLREEWGEWVESQAAMMPS